MDRLRGSIFILRLPRILLGSRGERDLENLGMLNDHILYYAKAIMSPDLEKVLLKRHTKIAAFIEKETFREDDWDWKSGEASDFEGFWREM